MSNTSGDDPKTPRMSPGPEEDNSRTPKATTSPATSTPGSSPASSLSSGLKDSELLSSDESIVDTSTIEKYRYVVTDMGATEKGSEMEIIEVTLTEKSVDTKMRATEKGREIGVIEVTLRKVWTPMKGLLRKVER